MFNPAVSMGLLIGIICPCKNILPQVPGEYTYCDTGSDKDSDALTVLYRDDTPDNDRRKEKELDSKKLKSGLMQ